jgi:hypothetical protein
LSRRPSCDPSHLLRISVRMVLFGDGESALNSNIKQNSVESRQILSDGRRSLSRTASNNSFP